MADGRWQDRGTGKMEGGRERRSEGAKEHLCSLSFRHLGIEGKGEDGGGKG